MSEKIIDIKDLRYEYSGEDDKKSIALDGISFSVNKGELISILGHNGSGKSTLAKLLNAQIIPTDGEIEIFGINTKNEERVWDIRQKCAMVFQNPDNQLVATVVEEDVAFGPENLGVPSEEIRQRVDEALKIVEMEEYKKHSPHMLSGGQKQRVAIAGILSMKPEVIIFDESTAMLDPIGRKDIMNTILKLNREVAKAILIDSAREWNEKPSPEEIALYGHGIVPIHINDIIKTSDDEIKFVVSDISEKWNTYNYDFPVPLKDNKYPYIAKATMCYFPLCDRLQGVDYTNTELNLHFGRIGDDKKIKDIKGDKQNTEDTLDGERNYLLEGEARKQFRKWDNVKYIAESATKRMIPKDSYRNKNWGMEIKTNNRLAPQDGVGVRFGVVVTLKEMNGVNRIDEFIRSCTLNGWLVNVIDVVNRVDIHQKVNEEIKWE